MQQYDHLFIDGELRASAGGRMTDVVSPSTEEVVGRAPLGSTADMDRAVAAARRAFDEGPWPRTSAAERGVILRRIAAGIEAAGEEISRLATDEVGMTIGHNTWVTQACADLLRYYADMAEQTADEEVRVGLQGMPFTVRREAVGVVAAVLAWNSPLLHLVAKSAPALAAGCTVVAKAPEETPLEYYPFIDAVVASGLPAGVLNIIPADREVSEHLVRHPGIDKVSFTGSTAAGRRIAEICGRDLKLATLELGGKSAAIVLEDAKLEDVVPAAVGSMIGGNGQVCLAMTRILLPRSRYGEFAEAITAAARTVKVGNPWAEDTQMGPLIAERQRTRVEGYVAAGLEQGARITTGGGRPKDLNRGWYFEPTVFVGVDNSMRIAREEIFGPVSSLIAHDGEADAVRIANDSDYGLAGAVFTQDPARGFRVARSIRTGSMGLNMFWPDFGAPAGGRKASGMGREYGKEGYEGYRVTKTIYAVDPEGAAQA